MNQEMIVEKIVYVKPVLEQHESYVGLTGISLPIGGILGEDEGGE